MNTFTSVSKSALSVSVSVINMAAREAMFHMTSEEGHRAHDCAMEVLSVVGLLALESADSTARSVRNASINAWEVAGNSYYTKSFVSTLNTAWEVWLPIGEFNYKAARAIGGLVLFTSAFIAAHVKVYCDGIVEASLEVSDDAILTEEFPIVEPMVKCAIASGSIVRSWVEPAPVAAEATVICLLSFLATEGGYESVKEFMLAMEQASL